MSENEHNFESLRQLLALKRHEIPPPGYFDNFSREVTARIRAEEASRTANVSSQLPWLSRLLSAFEIKPAFAGGFASMLCLLLLFGIIYAEQPDATPQPLLAPGLVASSQPAATPDVGFNSSAAIQTGITAISSTNPIFNVQSGPAWFGYQPAVPQPVNFQLPGN
ncbi:MAG TPA: hypothetical protein VFY06_13530 [Verrucomicrobiae bacterium]|nr:hypothetical protein [Verrucomicrobiae bacterium]